MKVSQKFHFTHELGGSHRDSPRDVEESDEGYMVVGKEGQDLQFFHLCNWYINMFLISSVEAELSNLSVRDVQSL